MSQPSSSILGPPPNWFSDIGITHHVTPDISSLSYINDYHGQDQLHVGDGNGLKISYTGYGKIHTPTCPFNISNMLHVS